MLWLRGKVEVQELLVSPGEAEAQETAQLRPLRVRPTGHWLTLDCAPGSVGYFDLRHQANPELGVFRGLCRLGGLAAAGLASKQLIAHAKSFSSTWGLPHLPHRWEYESRVKPRPVYCYPLAELCRMARLCCALSDLLRARFPPSKTRLLDAISGMHAVPVQELVPWGGHWLPRVALRQWGREAFVERFAVARGPMPPIIWRSGHFLQPIPSHIPEVFKQDPFWLVRWLAHDPDRVSGKDSRRGLAEIANRVALGVAVHVDRAPESLWSFVLEEWLQMYLRGGGTPYCQYVGPDGQPCAEPLPEKPANRRLCDEHRKVRRRETRANYASRKAQGSPGKGGPGSSTRGTERS